MFLMTMVGAMVHVNGTITAGGTSQQIQASKRNRSVFEFQNTSDTAMYINFGAAAAVADGILVAPGATWRSPANFCPNQAIHVFCATTGKAFNWFTN